MWRMDLAQWVVEEKLVTAEQLQRANELRRQTGVPLAMALLELGLVDERAIVDLVATRLGLPKAPRKLYKLTVPPRALSLIPQDYCWQYNVFPFGIDTATRRLLVAVVDPADQETAESVRKLAKLDLALYVAGPRQIEKAIKRHYLDAWVDETNAPAKRLRYFGYDNITNPGLGAAATSLPAQANAAASAATPPTPPPALPPSASQPTARPEPELAPTAESVALGWERPPERPQAAALEGTAPGKPDLELELPPPQGESDLPVLKATPATASALARIQTEPGSPDLEQRVERVERLLANLLSALAQSSLDQSDRLARMLSELQSRPRTR
jgi:hypothetical protein